MTVGRFAWELSALCAAAMLSSPAGAVPAPQFPAGAAAAVPVLLVCDPEGCRHRFKGYRARPNWNGYWARQAADGPAAERRPAAASRR